MKEFKFKTKSFEDFPLKEKLTYIINFIKKFLKIKEKEEARKNFKNTKEVRKSLELILFLFRGINRL